MKKVLSVVACGLLAACACDENQWEEVDVVTLNDATYTQPAPIMAEPALMSSDQAPLVYEPDTVVASQTVANASGAAVYGHPHDQATQVYESNPYAEGRAVVGGAYVTPVAVAVYDNSCAGAQVEPCYQAQSCGCQSVPVSQPQPKITTTKKIITTTTTLEEPCGKPVCEPVVTTHEEIVPAEVTYGRPQPHVAPAMVNYSGYNQAPVAAPQPNENMVNVTVESNPYRSEIVSMQDPAKKVDTAAAAKYKPEAYDVVASRATNRMLQDTSVVYDNGNTKTVFIKDTRLLSSDLPYGSHRLRGVTKDIISGSRTFDVVNNANDADFILETTADWYVTPNNPMPALQYKLAMFDRNGQKVNEWVEVIRQVQD